MSLWTLNGDLMLEQDVHVEGDDIISSCAFYEGTGNEYLERNLIFTGHRKGVVNVSFFILGFQVVKLNISYHRYGTSRLQEVVLCSIT